VPRQAEQRTLPMRPQLPHAGGTTMSRSDATP
jgi:hypothetical protein